MRILVVEDNKDFNSLITKTLKKAGYIADSCYDGEEAKLCLAGAEYDAVLLDIMMPKLNGYELLNYIRSSGNETPVLFLTSKDTVSRDGKAIVLLPKEFTLLEHFIKNQGIVLSREQLEDRAAGGKR